MKKKILAIVSITLLTTITVNPTNTYITTGFINRNNQ